MAGLVPFNRRRAGLANTGVVGFEDFHNMLDDFFSGNMLPNRNLLKDTFKIDIEEKENEYLIEAELPGILKDEVNLSVDGDSLCISVDRAEEVNNDGKNYIHRERRASSMSRRVRLAEANLDGIKAKLEDGILAITVPKDDKANTVRKINVD